MEMPNDNVLVSVFSWETVLFCFGIYFATLVVRKICEAVKPRWKSSQIWRETVLPLLPIFIGMALAVLARKYPIPESLDALSARLFFGAVLGGGSGWAYRFLKTHMKKKYGVDLSAAPPPEPGQKDQSIPPVTGTPRIDELERRQ